MKKNSTALGIISIVIILFVVLFIFAKSTMNTISGSDFGSAAGSGEAKIGVIEINNVIMSSKSTVEKLIQAEKDESIKGIIIRVNSPGGAVGPTQEIYEEIIRIDAKKPIYASFGSIAASGGYYVGAATRKIYSNAGTMTGSIGVIMNFMNLSEVYKTIKVNPYVIKAGKYKDIGNQNRDMTKEEKKFMQSMINGVHDQFISDIFKRRSTKITLVELKNLAQGQIFSGEDAKKKGLVDEIGSLWKAARDMHAVLKIETEFEMEFIKTKKESSPWRFLDKINEASSLIDRLSAETEAAPMFLYK